MFESLGDRWERLGSRERRLFTLLAVTGILCGILYAGFLIQEGLADLEKHNDDVRTVLVSLENRRDELIEAKSKQGEAVAMIGDEALALPTYLENVQTQAGVTIRNQSEKPTVTKGKFHEHGTEITLTDLNVDQLARFLRGIETQSQVVVTTSIKVTRSTIQKERIDRVQIVISTYARGKKAPAEKPAAAPPAEGAKP